MYIFLDVDGVLNTKADWKRFYSLNQRCVTEFIEFIKQIRNPKIVLSSSWRSGITRDGTKATHIEDLLCALERGGITTMDVTGVSPDGLRNKEIKHYLNRHPKDKYVILDDDITLFELGKNTERLYVVNPAMGFTATDRKLLLRKYGKG